MTTPAWAVSAAILLNRGDGLSIYELAKSVMDSGLSGLGRNVSKVEPYKILWSQLTRNCRQTHWFRASNNWVELIEPDDAAKNSKVLDALNRLDAMIGKKMPPLAEEVESDESLLEGALMTISVNAYERNSRARQRCIERHGARCSACELDFAERYGEVGVLSASVYESF